MLILICAILVAAGGATLSYYVDRTELGFSVEPDISATPAPTPTPTPPPILINVLYQTTEAWEQGHSGKFRFNYSITITNNSDQVIEDWYIRFTLPQDKLTSAWSAVMTKHLPAGQYEFVNPGYNNPATDNIAPGASVTFGGEGDGHGEEAPQNVQVGGSSTPLTDVTLTCEFGSLS